MKKDLKIYASYFASYLLDELEDFSNIKQIILFGSVAKGEAAKESDVDIFIHIDRKSKRLVSRIKKIRQGFYNSREALLFKARGIDNKISLIIGKLSEWKGLEDSIESTGIVLFGPYISSKTKGRKQVIFHWDRIKKNRGAFLNKIYGFRVRDRRYKGLIEKFNGRRLGKSSIMVPVEFREDVLRLIKKHGVNARIFEVWA